MVTNGKRKREKSEESSESVSTTEKSNKKSRLLNPGNLLRGQVQLDLLIRPDERTVFFYFISTKPFSQKFTETDF